MVGMLGLLCIGWHFGILLDNHLLELRSRGVRGDGHDWLGLAGSWLLDFLLGWVELLALIGGLVA